MASTDRADNYQGPGRSAFKPDEWTDEHYKNFLRSQVKLLVKPTQHNKGEAGEGVQKTVNWND